MPLSRPGGWHELGGGGGVDMESGRFLEERGDNDVTLDADDRVHVHEVNFR
jgi:hypothetical protein